MSQPPNSFRLAGGGRGYRWEDPVTHEITDVLSVTTIRTLCGMPPNLVTWKVSNVVNLATGMRKVDYLGPRGGKKSRYINDGPFPGQFVEKMLATEGDEETLARVRKWLTDTADEPRDIAAARGTTVHEAIERGMTPTQVDEAYVRDAFARNMTAGEVTADDIAFVRDCIVQHADLRATVPYVILGKELQVFELTAGYAGSFDCLLWILPKGTSASVVKTWQKHADEGRTTLDKIKAIGGEVVLGDYKTSSGLYTDAVCQITAYLSADFVVVDGVRDDRLTEILRSSMKGALLHIRPGEWQVAFFDFRPDVLRAFLGSCAFARFLALHEFPSALFTSTVKGKVEA